MGKKQSFEDVKQFLLSESDAEKYDIIDIKGLKFKARRINGMELFHIEKKLEEYVKDFTGVQYKGEVIIVPAEIKYIIGILHFIIEEPKLTFEEWAKVFIDKPGIFLMLSKKLSDKYFGSESEFSAFFSDELLKQEY